MRAPFKRLVVIAFTCVLFFVLGCTIFNTLANWYLNRIHPAPGQIYRVNGFPMHIYCTGRGTPTVILESGLGNDWLVWQKIQGRISETTRVCSYDRAGLGWSAERPRPRGALTIARQLKELLRVAGIGGPFVMVGHSAGGLWVRAFAGLFPHDVAGLLLVDASSLEMFAASNPEPRKALIAQRHRESPWLYVKVASGLSRLLDGYCNPNTMQRIPAVEGLVRAEDCRPSFMNSWLGEWDDLESSAKEVAKLGCCGDLPLLVLSSEPSLSGDQTWDTIQEQLKHLSSRGARVIALRSDHYVMVDRPELTVRCVRAVVDQTKGLPTFIRAGSTVSL